MYRVVIVDDEEEIRKGIVQKIEWDRLGFTIAGEAENGTEALEVIEACTPDVVITDITMPIMNGLELTSLIKESYPTIKVVILTGFNDFTFAQQAIKYGVSDYLLKPVLPNDIEALILKLKAEIDHEMAQIEDVKKLRKHYHESLPVLKDKYLTQLITSKATYEDKIQKRLSLLGIKLQGSVFSVAVADINADKNPAWNQDEDFELLKFAVLNMAQEIMEKYGAGEVFIYADNLVMILRSEDDKSAFNGKSFLILEELRQTIEKYIKVDIAIGIGHVCDSVSKISDSYKSALSALDYKLIIGGNKVIFIDDLEPPTSDPILFDEEKERLLVSSIKFGSEQDVTQFVELLFKEIGSSKISLKDCQLLIIDIVAVISKIARDAQVDMGSVIGPIQNLFVEVFKFTTLNDMQQWIDGICIKLMNQVRGKRQNSTAALLEKAKDYIHQNYSDNTLSIQKLSNYLHISSSYLSLIFKKEAGVTFLEFLVRIRLEAAQELMLDSDMKIAEIAERIGYPDLNYFSYFFKKNYGLSPREYRNKIAQKKGT